MKNVPPSDKNDVRPGHVLPQHIVDGLLHAAQEALDVGPGEVVLVRDGVWGPIQ